MGTYACTDLHGMKNLYNKIKEMTKNDTVYFLGDAMDRGIDGWEIMKDIMRQPNWKYIKGNHEDMLARALRKMVDSTYAEYSDELSLCYMNGGEPTIQAAKNDFQWLDGWRHELAKLPVKMEYVNKHRQHCILSHAGFTPSEVALSDEELIWSREHFHDAWPDDKKYENTFIIHGHTPVEFLSEELGYNTRAAWPLSYANGHKIDLDLCSAYSNTVALLNLDTAEITIVKGD